MANAGDPRIMTRDLSLIKAELVDAMQDYAAIFKEKADMELERYATLSDMAVRSSEEGAGVFTVEQSQDFQRRYMLLEMRHDELKMRVVRLMIERG